MTVAPPAPPRPVIWTEPALDDLDAIRSYIAAMNPGAARRIAEELVNAGESLSTFPLRGRGAGRTRQFVAVAPYVIRYRVRPNEVVILRVRHGRRRRT